MKSSIGSPIRAAPTGRLLGALFRLPVSGEPRRSSWAHDIKIQQFVPSQCYGGAEARNVEIAGPSP